MQRIQKKVKVESNEQLLVTCMDKMADRFILYLCIYILYLVFCDDVVISLVLILDIYFG